MLGDLVLLVMVGFVGFLLGYDLGYRHGQGEK